VIDSPPVLPAADVTQLAALADATLLVVRAQSTPRDLVVRACELLGDHLFGVVLNEATVESNPYYRHLSEYRQKVAVPSRREAARGEELNSSRAVDADSIGAPLQ
jgi:Mrp family chromosome partitioning ATPase